MRPQFPDGRDGGDGMDGAGAMADLILGTTGILLVVLVVLGPMALSRQAPVGGTDGRMPPARISVEGHAGPVLLAGPGGLVVPPLGTTIPVSGIAASPELAALGRGRPLLVVEPGGLEAAFHASARLAALGVGELDRVRLDRTCSDELRISRKGAALVLVCQGR